MAESDADTSNSQRSPRLPGRALTVCRSRYVSPPIPVRSERPLARSERLHLERLRQLVHVETQADRGVIAHPFAQVGRLRHRPRRHTTNITLDFLERVE